MVAVSEIRAVDESTVEIEFNEPAAYFESAMGLQPVVEPAFLEKMKSEASGTGAFMVQEWVPGDHLTMVKNPELLERGPATGRRGGGQDLCRRGSAGLRA